MKVYYRSSCLTILAFVVLAVVFFTGYAGAVGFGNLDLGSKRVGMMGVVGVADDPTAIYSNPAGLAQQKGSQLYYSQELAYAYSKFRLRYSDGSMSETVSPDISAGACPFFAYTDDFHMEKLTFGLALYFPNAYGAALPEDAPTRFHIIRGWFVTGYITPTVAYQALDNLSFGLGVSYMYVSLYGHRKMGDWEHPDSGNPEGDLTIRGSDYGWNGIAGVLYKPWEPLQIGLSYTPRTNLVMEGDFDYEYLDFELHGTQYTTMVIPQSVRLGFSYQATKKLNLVCDLGWWDYSVYKEQKTRTDPELLTLIVEKDYSDGYYTCAGMLYQLNKKYGIMAGFQKDFSPIPMKSYTLENPQSDLWGLSTGLTWAYSEKLQINLAILRTWYKHVDIKDSNSTPPTNGEGKGGMNEFNIDFLYRF